MGCFSTKVEAPAPPPVPEESQTEKDLKQEQLDWYKWQKQQAQQAATEAQQTQQEYEKALGMPLPQYIAQTTKSQGDLSKLYMERYQKGLKGELPVDPALERSLQENEFALKEKLRGQGLDETSTPAIQSLAEYAKRAEELRQAARTGAITEGEQAGYASSPLTYAPKLFAARTTPTEAVANLSDLWSKYNANRALQSQFALAGYNAANQAALFNAQQPGDLATLLKLGLGIGKGAGAGALMGSAGMLKGLGAGGGAGLGALLAI